MAEEDQSYYFSYNAYNGYTPYYSAPTPNIQYYQTSGPMPPMHNMNQQISHQSQPSMPTVVLPPPPPTTLPSLPTQYPQQGFDEMLEKQRKLEAELKELQEMQPKKTRKRRKPGDPVVAKLRRSCDACTKRRRKCDGVHPICGLCTKFNRECVYQVNLKSLPDKVAKEIIEKGTIQGVVSQIDLPVNAGNVGIAPRRDTVPSVTDPTETMSESEEEAPLVTATAVQVQETPYRPMFGNSQVSISSMMSSTSPVEAPPLNLPTTNLPTINIPPSIHSSHHSSPHSLPPPPSHESPDPTIFYQRPRITSGLSTDSFNKPQIISTRWGVSGDPNNPTVEEAIWLYQTKVLPYVPKGVIMSLVRDFPPTSKHFQVLSVEPDAETKAKMLQKRPSLDVPPEKVPLSNHSLTHFLQRSKWLLFKVVKDHKRQDASSPSSLYSPLSSLEVEDVLDLCMISTMAIMLRPDLEIAPTIFKVISGVVETFGFYHEYGANPNLQFPREEAILSARLYDYMCQTDSLVAIIQDLPPKMQPTSHIIPRNLPHPNPDEMLPSIISDVVSFSGMAQTIRHSSDNQPLALKQFITASQIPIFSQTDTFTLSNGLWSFLPDSLRYSLCIAQQFSFVILNHRETFDGWNVASTDQEEVTKRLQNISSLVEEMMSRDRQLLTSPSTPSSHGFQSTTTITNLTGEFGSLLYIRFVIFTLAWKLIRRLYRLLIETSPKSVLSKVDIWGGQSKKVRQLLPKAPLTLSLDIHLEGESTIWYQPVTILVDPQPTVSPNHEKQIRQLTHQMEILFSSLYWFGRMGFPKSKACFQYLIVTFEELVDFVNISKTFRPKKPEDLPDFDVEGWLSKLDLSWSGVCQLWSTFDEE